MERRPKCLARKDLVVRNPDQSITVLLHRQTIVKVRVTAQWCRNHQVQVQMSNPSTYIPPRNDEVATVHTATLGHLRRKFITVLFQTMASMWIQCGMVHWRRHRQMAAYQVNPFSYTIPRRSSTTGWKIFSIRTAAALRMDTFITIPVMEMPSLFRLRFIRAVVEQVAVQMNHFRFGPVQAPQKIITVLLWVLLGRRITVTLATMTTITKIFTWCAKKRELQNRNLLAEEVARGIADRTVGRRVLAPQRAMMWSLSIAW